MRIETIQGIFISQISDSLQSLYIGKKPSEFSKIFFPQHANMLNITNILKYASIRINSFIYRNIFYYIIDSNIIEYHKLETFQ